VVKFAIFSLINVKNVCPETVFVICPEKLFGYMSGKIFWFMSEKNVSTGGRGVEGEVTKKNLAPPK
jgi:hypothetical protein